jgi:CubicO group peptidase (beta-lactamase class C family)
MIDPRFQAVEEAFRANFAAGLEVGAACAVVADGRVVVDLWGGRCWTTGPPWEAHTMVETRSVTKGVAALCLHILVDRGLVDPDAPVRTYWPELRADPLVRHVLTHEAGIPVIDAPLPEGAILDWDVMAAAIAAQEPEWEPGARTGYHGVTFGWLVGEVVRRVSGRSIGRFLADEVTGPLGVDYFIGTPASEHHRIAPLVVAPPRADGRPIPPAFTTTQPPDSLAARVYAPMYPPISPRWNSPEFRSAEIPVANGIGTARALAVIFGELARGGGRLVSEDAVREMSAERVDGIDAVLGMPVRRSLGFDLPTVALPDGRPPHAFGHPGASGFLAFADPEAGIGFAYVKNAGSNADPGQDRRASSLVNALYDCL